MTLQSKRSARPNYFIEHTASFVIVIIIWSEDYYIVVRDVRQIGLSWEKKPDNRFDNSNLSEGKQFSKSRSSQINNIIFKIRM